MLMGYAGSDVAALLSIQALWFGAVGFFWIYLR